MANFKRKDFRRWYEKYHELEEDRIFVKKRDENNGKGLELHHIIPFKTVNHNISIKIVDSLLNLIYLDKDLHDKLSESINVSDIRYFGIEFKKYENDENGEYNCISFFDIRFSGNSDDKYFKYKNEIKFKNGELVFFKPELAMAIERYNKICLEINKIQLKGIRNSIQLKKNEICIKSLNEFLENILSFSKKINYNEQLYFRGESSDFDFRTPSLYRHETLTIEGSEYYYRKLLNELGRDDYLENSTLVRLISELQHYGAKTRMLDITSNPLIALYFAVEKNDNNPGFLYIYKSNTENEKFDTGHTIAIKSALNFIPQGVIDNFLKATLDFLGKCGDISEEFRIDEIEKMSILDEKSIKNMKLFMELLNQRTRVRETLLYPIKIFKNLQKSHIVLPSKITDRIKQQQGAFIYPKFVNCSGKNIEVIKKEISESIDELRFIIESEIETERDESYYPIIKIDGKYKKEIRSQLEILGITEGFVYPDISHHSEALLKKQLST